MAKWRHLYSSKVTRMAFVLWAWFACGVVHAETMQWDWRGHLKGLGNYQDYSTGSLYEALAYDHSKAFNIDGRLGLMAEREGMRFELHYQQVLQIGDEVELARRLAGTEGSNAGNNSGLSALWSSGSLSDDQRLFDFTHALSDGSRHQWLHRLDRANLTFYQDHWVVKAGRQAISWGNGLMYNPMDFFNPFSPTQVDKEYKNGDDMLYGQYLTNAGDDVQAVWVVRRDALGDINHLNDSIAAKYHLFWQRGFWGQEFDEPVEVDLLLAQHFQDHILAVGITSSLGNALWRSDAMLTHVDAVNTASPQSGEPIQFGSDKVLSLVTNLSYSWVWQPPSLFSADNDGYSSGINLNASIEYFYNGFGQDNGQYGASELIMNRALLSRIVRGELYSLGRHYLAGSITMELSPLWLFTPSAFVNLSDDSALIQIVSQHDLQQNLQLLAAVNVPIGATGTEFGGIEIPTDGFNTMLGEIAPSINPLHLGNDFSAQIQLAWYF